MKKLLTLLLALTLCVGVFASCNGTGSTVEADVEELPVYEKLENVTYNLTDEEKQVKIGLICLHDTSSTYDKNFIDSMYDAVAELGISRSNVLLATGIAETGSACYNKAKEFIEAGCTVLFADSFGHESDMLRVANEYPDVQVCHATGTQSKLDSSPNNYHNAFASIYEGRYLAGIAAGMKLNEMINQGKFTAAEAKIGYVGAYPYAEVKSGYTSFYLGVKSVCPTVTMEVSFTNSWYNVTREKNEAVRLIANGCKLISQHADSMGAPSACEEAGVPNVSYNGSTAEECPSTFIVSSRIDWTPYFKLMINNTVKGVTEGWRDYTGTLATGSVKLTGVNKTAAAAGTIEAIVAARTKLGNNEIHIFDTENFTKNGVHLTSYLADVVDTGDFQGETEVISDGYFHESEYRSAPYFDIDIDGITLLTTDYDGE